MLRCSAFSWTAATLACVDAATRGSSSAQVDTLPSGIVRVTNSGDPAWTDDNGWTLVEDLRLGSLDGTGPTLFAQIAAILPDDAGNIYILDYPTQEIRVFNASGDHLRTIGGEGQGPGELRGARG
jgi:hypothetical protein